MFREGYERLSIETVCDYIVEHDHLPWMRSAEEVEREGIGRVHSQLPLCSKCLRATPADSQVHTTCLFCLHPFSRPEGGCVLCAHRHVPNSCSDYERDFRNLLESVENLFLLFKDLYDEKNRPTIDDNLKVRAL